MRATARQEPIVILTKAGYFRTKINRKIRKIRTLSAFDIVFGEASYLGDEIDVHKGINDRVWFGVERRND